MIGLLVMAVAASADMSPPPLSADVLQGAPVEAASAALGDRAAAFAAHELAAQPIIAPPGMASVYFYETPVAYRSRLCAARFLTVSLRAETAANRSGWRAVGATWSRSFWMASKTGEPCLARPFGASPLPVVYGGRPGVFTAPDSESAWQGVALAEAVTMAAHRKGRLGFDVKCAGAGRGDCRRAGSALAGISLRDIEDVQECAVRSADCIAVEFHAPGGFGHDYWRLEIKAQGRNPTKVRTVSMTFEAPPVA